MFEKHIYIYIYIYISINILVIFTVHKDTSCCIPYECNTPKAKTAWPEQLEGQVPKRFEINIAVFYWSMFIWHAHSDHQCTYANMHGPRNRLLMCNCAGQTDALEHRWGNCHQIDVWLEICINLWHSWKAIPNLGTWLTLVATCLKGTCSLRTSSLEAVLRL